MRMELDGHISVAVVVLEDVMVGVGMAGTASCQVGLQSNDDERRDHSNEPSEWPVTLAEEVGQTRVGQGDEGGGKEVDEGCRDEDASAEVLT